MKILHEIRRRRLFAREHFDLEWNVFSAFPRAFFFLPPCAHINLLKPKNEEEIKTHFAGEKRKKKKNMEKL